MINWVPNKKISNINEILEDSINQNQFTNYGPCVKKLEEIIKKKLIIDDTKSGIELLKNKKMNWATQSFTFPPSAQGPLSNTLIIDIDDDGGLDISKIPKGIEGIIVTNIFGNIVDINKYINYCNKNDIILLFDNAATPFTFYEDKNCVNYGLGSIISFHHTKPIGFGEGGAIIVD